MTLYVPRLNPHNNYSLHLHIIIAGNFPSNTPVLPYYFPQQLQPLQPQPGMGTPAGDIAVLRSLATCVHFLFFCVQISGTIHRPTSQTEEYQLVL